MPIGIDRSMANVPSAYDSLATFDAVELRGGWADGLGMRPQRPPPLALEGN